jgi:hypothetical protein
MAYQIFYTPKEAEISFAEILQTHMKLVVVFLIACSALVIVAAGALQPLGTYTGTMGITMPPLPSNSLTTN